MLNLRNKILILTIVLVMGSQLATLTMVLLTTRANEIDRANNVLSNNTRLLIGLTSSQAAQTESMINALASDFAFKTAIATSDIPTVRSALENQRKRVGADIALVLDDNQAMLAATSLDNDTGDNMNLVLNEYTPDDPKRNIILMDGTTYFTVTVPIRAPLPIGWLSMGYPLDKVYVDRAKDLVGQQLSVFNTNGNEIKLIASTLPDDLHPELTDVFESSFVAGDLLEPAIRQIGGADYLVIRSDFIRGQENLQVFNTVNMDEALSTYALIYRAAIFLASIPLFAALFGALLFSRALTRPIRDLVHAAKRIQAGDYDQSITIDTADELNEFAIAFNSMQKEIAAREKRIAYQAKHDGLTGLYNREFALDNLGSLLRQAKDEDSYVAVLILSLNARQELSSSLGHEIADAYLEEAASAVRDMVEGKYIVARLELDSFLIILTNTDPVGANQMAQDLAHRLSTGIRIPDITVAVKPRIGIAVFPEHGETKERLMLRATIAKSEGTANDRPVSIYREGDEELRVRNLALLHDLRTAVQEDRLIMHYQPKIRVADESISGVEALVRWDHDTYGWLPPNEFIPIIEQSGNISILTRWALETVCRDYQKWRAQGLDLEVAVNFSAHDLQDHDLPWFIMDILRESGLPPEKLTAEITEQAMVQNFENAKIVLTRLRDLGMRISIDDFGTGYSSLSQLKRLPADELKIDRAFVNSLPGDQADEAIVSTAIELAHKLKLETVAEGVSSGASYRWLQVNGIDRAQGFYWSKALPSDELAAWVENYSGGSTRFVEALDPEKLEALEI